MSGVRALLLIVPSLLDYISICTSAPIVFIMNLTTSPYLLVTSSPSLANLVDGILHEGS